MENDKLISLLYYNEPDMESLRDSTGRCDPYQIIWEPVPGIVHNVFYKKVVQKCTIDQEYATNVISLLSKCTCCDRHQIDRPTKYLPRRPSNTIPSCCKPDRCDCQCRSLSRLICYELYFEINN